MSSLEWGQEEPLLTDVHWVWRAEPLIARQGWAPQSTAPGALGGGLCYRRAGGRASHLLIPPPPRFSSVASGVGSELYGQQGLTAWFSLRWLPMAPGFPFLSPKPETVFAHHLHTFACGVAGPSRTWGKHIFLARVLASLDPSPVYRDEAIKLFLHLTLPPPPEHPFLHLPPPGSLVPKPAARKGVPVRTWLLLGLGSAAHLLCELTSHFSSQRLNLPL